MPANVVGASVMPPFDGSQPGETLRLLFSGRCVPSLAEELFLGEPRGQFSDSPVIGRFIVEVSVREVG